MRKQFYPDDKVAFSGINTWRGVTRRKPILGGRTYMRIGSINTGKIVIYPIVDNVDGDGNQLINWMAEIKRDTTVQNDWNKPGDLADFYPDLRRLAVRLARRRADDPRRRPDPGISDGRQGPDRKMDFRPRHLGGRRRASDVSARLERRGAGGDRCAHAGRLPAQRRRSARGAEGLRRRARASGGKVVETNRATPPDFINIKVEELVGDKPFDNLDDYISQDELRALSDNYKRIAGFRAWPMSEHGSGCRYAFSSWGAAPLAACSPRR